MNIQIKHYDRILVIRLEETVTDPDLVQVAGFINSASAKVSHVLVDVEYAQMAPGAVATLLKLKALYDQKKIGFRIVSPELPQANDGDLQSALKAIQSNESPRIAEILMHETEIELAGEQAEAIRAELAARLGIKDAARPEALEEIRTALNQLEKGNRGLLLLYKTLSSEIRALKKHGGEAGAPDPQAIKAISETRKKILKFLDSNGTLGD